MFKADMHLFQIPFAEENDADHSDQKQKRKNFEWENEILKEKFAERGGAADKGRRPESGARFGFPDQVKDYCCESGDRDETENTPHKANATTDFVFEVEEHDHEQK